MQATPATVLIAPKPPRLMAADSSCDASASAVQGQACVSVPVLHGRPTSSSLIGAQLAPAHRPGHEALLLAISRRNVDKVRLLLRQGIDAQSAAGHNAAHLAAIAGHAAALPLLQTAGEDMKAKTPAGDTPLLLAARHGHVAAVRFLAKTADLYHANNDGDSALTLAAAAGHSTIVQRLLVKGANVNHVNSRLDTALMAASRAGHLDVILALLANDPCVSQTNLARETALTLASANGASTVVELLKAKGATTLPGPNCVLLRKGLDKLEAHNSRLLKEHRTYILRWSFGEETSQSAGDGATMVMLLARAGSMMSEELALHLRYCADPGRVDNQGHNALMYAAQFLQTESISALLAAGVGLGCRGRYGVTALHLATAEFSEYGTFRNRQVATVSLLLDKGAEIDCRADDGCTALHLAAASGAVAVVKLLLKRGASPCASTDGNTALTYAAKEGRVEMVKYLLDWGADPGQTNNEGNNALDCAMRENRTTTAAMLRARGVKPARH